MLRAASVIASGLVVGYFFGNLILGVLLVLGAEMILGKPTY